MRRRWHALWQQTRVGLHFKKPTKPSGFLGFIHLIGNEVAGHFHHGDHAARGHENKEKSHGGFTKVDGQGVVENFAFTAFAAKRFQGLPPHLFGEKGCDLAGIHSVVVRLGNIREKREDPSSAR